jgi:hypothetical protein
MDKKERNKMNLYHGSPRELKGKELIPTQPEDVNENENNLVKGVYATDVKNAAIAMAIISCDGVNGASLDMRRKVPGIIYEGKPNQNFIYLHTLDSKGFRELGKHQYVSENPVKPIKTEKLKIKDYISFVRNADDEEKRKWNEKLNAWKKKKGI